MVAAAVVEPGCGVYVHYPYCRRHCPYCDFNVTVRAVEPEAYRDAVIAELAARADAFEGPALSVYFGGGTPGLWRADCIGAVVDAVDARLGTAGDVEVTVECNPEDVTVDGVRALAAAGVNRVSLGCQSFDDDVLRRLGRMHSGAQNAEAAAAVLAGGVDRLCIDLIHGVAGQGVAGACADVRDACALGPTHVSFYELTVEEKTPFGARSRRGEVLTADDDALLEMYEGVRAALRSGGLVPYEVSNAAVPGHEAVHNSLYWTGAPYLGLGAGAHGFRRIGAGGERWENERHAGRYVGAALAGAPAETFREAVDADAHREERLMCGLRLDRGMEVDEETVARYGERAARAVDGGLLETAGRRWRATARGRALLDRLLRDLIA